MGLIASSFAHLNNVVPGVLNECEIAIGGSKQNVVASVTQNKIARKTSYGCAHSAVKMLRLTLTIRPKQKVFLSYVGNIVRTVRVDIKELLEAVNNLHPNIQFTLETTDDKNSLPLLHKLIKQPEGAILCHGIQNHQIMEQF